MLEDAHNRIRKYLKETFNIRNIMERVPMRITSGKLSTWVLAPWAIESISINCALSVEETTRILESMPDVEVVEQESETGRISVVRWLGTEPPLYPDESNLPEPGGRVRDFINLHNYNYLVQRTGNEGRPVKLEDMLFDLKNAVMLPDDFMPDYLMGNLEGKNLPAPDYIVENLQPFSGRTDVYCYFEHADKGPGSLAYLFAASPAHGRITGNQEIEKIIGDSFRALSRDPDYVHFELSRYMKTILFSIRRYRSNELRRPLPPPHIIEIMKGKGIIAEINGRYIVPEDVSAAQLEKMLEAEKHSAEALSSRWLESMVK